MTDAELADHARSVVGGTARMPAQRNGRNGADVALLGGFRLAVGGREVRLSVGTQRLVALLALRGQVSRSRLAGTLWPDTLEHRALASLRTGIWRVNQAAPGLVVITATQVDLNARTRVDVRVLVKWAIEIMQGGDFDAFTIFAGVPAGELLPGWEDAWLIDERERLHQMRLHLLEKVAERFADTGHFGLAVEVAMSVLRADVLRESAHRTLIGIHLAEGNVDQARRAYAACKQLLWRELGVAPSAAMTGLLSGSRTALPS